MKNNRNPLKIAIGLLICLGLGGESVVSQEAPHAAPRGMVYVEAGPFMMGSNLYQKDEKPLRQVTLDAFYIDITEVSMADYGQCVRSRKCSRPKSGKSFGRGFPPMGANHPAIGVTWYDAENYCSWAGKRLPTEAEWEKAARGNTGFPYPWGTVIDCEHANYYSCKINHPQPVGSYPKGRSPYGALDMAGNVQEWVRDWYDPTYYRHAPNENPPGPADGVKKVLRGGSYDYVWSSVRTSYRFRDLPKNFDNGYGFRCAKSAK